MTISTTLQCQRVRTTRGEPIKGSGRALCTICNEHVFMSKTARDLATIAALRPVCEICKPANSVNVTRG